MTAEECPCSTHLPTRSYQTCQTLPLDLPVEGLEVAGWQMCYRGECECGPRPLYTLVNGQAFSREASGCFNETSGRFQKSLF